MMRALAFWCRQLRAAPQLTFSLSPTQADRLHEWQRSLENEACMLEVMVGNRFRLGGDYTFTFTPSAIGTVVMVRHQRTGATIDLTEMPVVDTIRIGKRRWWRKR